MSRERLSRYARSSLKIIRSGTGEVRSASPAYAAVLGKQYANVGYTFDELLVP